MVHNKSTIACQPPTTTTAAWRWKSFTTSAVVWAAPWSLSSLGCDRGFFMLWRFPIEVIKCCYDWFLMFYMIIRTMIDNLEIPSYLYCSPNPPLKTCGDSNHLKSIYLAAYSTVRLLKPWLWRFFWHLEAVIYVVFIVSWYITMVDKVSSVVNLNFWLKTTTVVKIFLAVNQLFTVS